MKEDIISTTIRDSEDNGETVNLSVSLNVLKNAVEIISAIEEINHALQGIDQASISIMKKISTIVEQQPVRKEAEETIRQAEALSSEKPAPEGSPLSDIVIKTVWYPVNAR